MKRVLCSSAETFSQIDLVPKDIMNSQNDLSDDTLNLMSKTLRSQPNSEICYDLGDVFIFSESHLTHV